MTAKMTKVFISYAREDSEIAQRLFHDLRRIGVSAWFDTQNLRPGEDWQRAIRKAIEESTYFLALISQHSTRKRGFVQKEIRYALEVLDKLPPDQIFVIPVRLGECEPQYERIQSLNYVDLFRSYDDGIERILQFLATSAVLPSDTANSSDRITKPSGKLTFFKDVLDRSPLDTQAAIRKRLDMLLTSSNRGHRLVENLFLESHLGNEDWIELINSLESTDSDVHALIQTIAGFSEKRILLGLVSDSGLDRHYYCFRRPSVVMSYMLRSKILDVHDPEDILNYSLEGYISLSSHMPEVPLGRDPMWSTFDLEEYLGNEISENSLWAVATDLWVDTELENESLILFRYKLRSDNPPRLPTFCDLYSGRGWLPDASVPPPYARYSWTMPVKAISRPRPEVVHGAVTFQDVISIFRIPPRRI